MPETSTAASAATAAPSGAAVDVSDGPVGATPEEVREPVTLLPHRVLRLTDGWNTLRAQMETPFDCFKRPNVRDQLCRHPTTRPAATHPTRHQPLEAAVDIVGQQAEHC